MGNREVEATKLVVLEKQILVQLTSKFKPSKKQLLIHCNFSFKQALFGLIGSLLMAFDKGINATFNSFITDVYLIFFLLYSF